MNNAIAVSATLPIDSAARLPATYETARNAIAECERIDECKTWSDKAAALAAYSRQAKDDSLRVMAVRIQARAVRRMGELLKQEPTAQGARTDLGRVTTRSNTADAAGISDHQRKQALRVASIPAEDFDYAVESQDPPTVTELADRGTQPRPDTGPAPNEPIAADGATVMAAAELLSRFSQFCEATDVAQIARAIHDESEVGALASNVELIVQKVASIDRWLDRLVAHLVST